MAPSRHAHASCNAVSLVWGSLRLAPTKLSNNFSPSLCNAVSLVWGLLRLVPTKLSNNFLLSKYKPVTFLVVGQD